MFDEMILGAEYIEVTEFVGGVRWEIRDSDWATPLADVAALTTEQLPEFVLALTPVVDTLEVEVQIESDGFATELQAETDYRYDAETNAVVLLEYVAPDGSWVEIRYEEDES